MGTGHFYRSSSIYDKRMREDGFVSSRFGTSFTNGRPRARPPFRPQCVLRVRNGRLPIRIFDGLEYDPLTHAVFCPRSRVHRRWSAPASCARRGRPGPSVDDGGSAARVRLGRVRPPPVDSSVVARAAPSLVDAVGWSGPASSPGSGRRARALLRRPARPLGPPRPPLGPHHRYDRPVCHDCPYALG